MSDAATPAAQPAPLPLLPTMGVGSCALPGWMFPLRQAIRDGRLGPDDIDEAFDDATRVVIADQIEAGFDILSDGELRRQRFVYDLFERLEGLERLPPARRLGLPGYDTAPRFRALAPLRAPAGLGIVAEYTALARLAPGRRLKVALPGPLSFARAIAPDPHYGAGREAEEALLADLAAAVRAEIGALAAAGATRIQLDEPGLTRPPFGRAIGEVVPIVNAALGASSDLAVHVCFGNNASRPEARRDLGPLLADLARLRCRQLVLEFANRQMSEVERLAELSERFDIAAGVIDVKSYHEETEDDVAGRIRAVLAHVPAGRLAITADCGFSAIPRWLARRKMASMVAGARRVRAALGG
jgi:5-methyltetrahydropteroyltriglutamate--homocysteine methyltransferase